jgi:general secretion pathway protein N
LVLLVNAPARLLGYALPSQQVLLQGFSGSFWHGSADSAALAVAGGHLQLGRLQWNLSPVSLLLLSPRVEVETRWGRQSLAADIKVSRDGKLRLRDCTATLPASLVRQWLPVQLRGSLNFLTEDLSFSGQYPHEGSGRLVWQDAHWIGNTTSQDLGDYVLEFDVKDAGQVEGRVSTLSGPIMVQGTVKLAQQQYSLDLMLSSESGIPPELGNALQLVAEPTDSGYRVKLDGTL